MTESKIKKFLFEEFISNSLNIKLKSIDFILKHIESTLLLIYTSKTNLSLQHLNEYHQISIVYKLLNNIMKYGINIGGEYNEKKLYNPLNINEEKKRKR